MSSPLQGEVPAKRAEGEACEDNDVLPLQGEVPAKRAEGAQEVLRQATPPPIGRGL